jgi:acyl phosphate:glycerol-3-phosphate acyltransferase
MTNDLMLWIGFIVLAYFSGSIPFGLLVGLTKGVDIRKVGSGNIGATNAGRALGKRVGAVCFALDVSKGALPVLIAGFIMETLGDRAPSPAHTAWWSAIAAAAILGHMFPVWLRFKGGKGVATGFGALAAMWPVASVAAFGALAIWLLCVRLTHYVGVSSCAAAVSLPFSIALFAMMTGQSNDGLLLQLQPVWPAVALTTVLAIAVVWKHRGNISRTFAGTEPKTNLLG